MARLRAGVALCAVAALAVAGCLGPTAATPDVGRPGDARHGDNRPDDGRHGDRWTDDRRADDRRADDRWADESRPEAQAGPLTARELVEIRSLTGLMISPDGRHAAVRVDRSDIAANQIHLVWRILDLQGGATRAQIDGGQPRFSVNGGVATEAPQWSPDSRAIYLRRLEGEQVQLWKAGRDGEGLRQITHDASDVVAFIVDDAGDVHYATGPATRAQIKAAEQDEYDNGVLLDRTYIVGLDPTHNFPVNGRMATVRNSPEARNHGRATLLGETPLRVMTLTPGAETATPAASAVTERFAQLWDESAGGFLDFDPRKAARAQSRTPARSASLGLHDPGGSGTSPRSRYHLTWSGAGGSGECSDAVCTDSDHIAVVGWGPGGGELIFQTWTNGLARLSSWDVETASVRTLFEAEGVLGSSDAGVSGACQIAISEAVCVFAGPDRPPALIGIDLATGAVRTLLNPNPEITPGRLGVAHRISLADRFGNTSLAYAILPRDHRPGQRRPLVITSYSCRGFLLGGSGHDVPEHVLAGLGFVAACVDSSGAAVRLAPDFSYTAETGSLMGLDFFEDAVRQLDEAGLIDPDRVMLTGFSGSATDTAAAISRSGTFTAAAVMTTGSLDAILCYLASHYRSCANLSKAAGHPLPYDSRNGFLAHSPAWNADRITAPLLMQLPEPEYPSMMQLYGALLDYGRAVEMIIFSDAFHYKSQPRQRLSVYGRNVDWAEFWLRGRTSEDPADALQNARWVAMREQQCRLFAGEGAPGDPPWYCRP